MAMRVTGMMSGLDTESIIQQLVAARQTKVDDLKKKQTQHGWKQEAWKDLNAKIYKLYNGSLNNLQYTSSFVKKTTTVSNSNLVSVITKDTAMDSVQSLKIKQLAKAGYLTGGKIKGAAGQKLSSSSKVAESLGIEAGSTFEVNTNGKKTEITIDENTTINSLVNQLKAAGVGANFDAGQQRFYIGASDLGEEADFTIIGSNSKGTDALDKLGILLYDEKTKEAYKEYATMSNDDIVSLKQSRIDARVAALVAERESLNKSNDELTEKLKACADDYNQAYGEGGTYDLEDAGKRTARKTELETKISALEAKTELSAEEQADLNKAKAEMTYINGYEGIQEDIKKNDDRLAEIAVSVDADGNATADLEAEIGKQVDDKIAEAVRIYADYANLEGTGSASNKQVGQNSVIELNGVEYSSDSNTFDINGLTITCNGTTAENESITLSTKNDTSGIYNMIKNFITEYSALINEMDKLYNAESAKGYEPLTDDEKQAMSESEIEKWESKIKESLLRRDSTLSTVSSAMKEIMMSGFEVNGKKMYLYDFGIETMGYFNAAENEKNAYHIYGDEDDDAFKNETNKLMAMINSDPDAVVGFFTQLSQKLYGKMFDMMKGTEFSSVYKVYDDKKMKEEYDDYTTKIAEAEKKLQEYEDKWYKKFAAMETAMAKMQSNASAVTALLGGS
ncbi:MAG: flagellar filament capping protein FliD [Lachnospiraceae bacterium]|nr:flagellar filament capping protein FliD [Lachnospiraceae bacterium]MDE6185603.1 flagellar filament capping protein FliD [Lachnospiraceae bacterium]